MSKMSNAVGKMQEVEKLHPDEIVTNFMGGDSYKLDPLETLKIVAASSFYGEPSYYRASADKKSYGRQKYGYAFSKLIDDSVLGVEYANKTTNEIFETLIDKALSFDFGKTLEYAVELRKEKLMRMNPQIIMVRAALHEGRKTYTEANPGKFDEINQLVMSRADEPMTQMAYYMYKNKSDKSKMPSVLKRSWAKNLSKLNRYKVAKYKNAEIGMINAVRICHANSPVLDELMKTGTVEVKETDKTWENLRSEGKSWKKIFDTIKMGHMALLRNLRGVFKEVDDIEFCKKYLETLKAGVIEGKQFPFRYYSAKREVEKSDCNHRSMIIDTLEECFDIALANFPKLKGKTMCLSDNSGSAWGTIPSEYGRVTVAEIDNLSSVITAACSDDGYVGKFGDKLIVYPISKRQGILAQAEKISDGRGRDVGPSTEGGIWEFFKNAIEKKEHWDNIVIYSDQQAGTGGLYGTYIHKMEYEHKYGVDFGMINVYKLILEYRKKVNPKVNVLSVQTAGYENVVIPQNAYRTSIQAGWTGKEAVYFDEVNKLWDEADKNHATKAKKQK